MVKLFVVSHGNLCTELVNSLEMITGKGSDIPVLGLFSGDDPEMYRLKMEQVLEKLTADGSSVLVLADLRGGTPFNSAFYFSQSFDLQIITGANLPMLIGLAFSDLENLPMHECVRIAMLPHNVGVKHIGDEKRV